MAGERAQYTLVATDGTRYEIDASLGVTGIVYSDGVAFSVSASGITGPGNEGVAFTQDAEGRFARVQTNDGRMFDYTYDASGNLVSARNLAAGTSVRYAYADPDSHRLTLLTGAGAGQTVEYGSTVTTRTIAGDLGAALNYLSREFSGSLAAGATDLYTFAVRPSEIALPQGGAALIGVVIEATGGSTLAPAVPTIDGLTAVASRAEGNRAFALYRIDEAGLKTLRVGSTGAGAYTMRLFAAGDADADGKVDGIDAGMVAAARGKQAGDAGFVAAADANFDGLIDATDSQLMFANLGYAPNQGPSVGAGTGFTHVELETAINVSAFLTDPEGDPLTFRILSSTNGTARLSGDGTKVLFRPEDGFSGAADFVVVADDGYTLSAPGTVAVTVSAAPLVALDFLARESRIGVGGSEAMQVIGDFADQNGVLLPASYLTFASTNAAAGRVGTDGRLIGVSQGYGGVTVGRGDIQAATAFMVGLPADLLDAAVLLGGLEFYPGSVTVAANGGARQILLTAVDDDVAQAADGTRYFSSNRDVIEITADGRILGRNPGEAIVTAIHKMVEVLIAVKVATPQNGPTIVGEQGAVVTGAGGLQVAVAPGALDGDTTVSIESADVATFGIALPSAAEGFTFGAAFHLDTGGEMMTVPAQLAIPTPTLAPGTDVRFYRVADIPAPGGLTQRVWLETESGVVGADGVARTQSPPQPGVQAAGDYAVLGIDPTKLATLRLINKVTIPFGDFVAATLPIFALSPLLGGAAIAAAAIAEAMAVTIALFPRPLDMRVVLPDGSLSVSTHNVTVDELRVGTLTVETNAAFDPDDHKPRLTAMAVRIEPVAAGGAPEPLLEIKGYRLRYAYPDAPEEISVGRRLGTDADDVKLVFMAGDREIGTASVIDIVGAENDLQTLRARVPNDIPLGSVSVMVKRSSSQIRTNPDGTPVWVPFIPVQSNALRVEGEGRYVFAAVAGDDSVSVMDTVASANGTFEANEIIARIPVGDAQTRIPYMIPEYVRDAQGNYVLDQNQLRVRAVDGSGNPLFVQAVDANGFPIFTYTSAKADLPRAVGLTSDNSRGYVTLRSSQQLAVFDAITLQPLDVVKDVAGDPFTQGIQSIALPADSRPFWVAIDDKQGLAFVGDEGFTTNALGVEVPTGGRIYVVDIDPASATFHKFLGTIYTKELGVELAPFGIRGMTVLAEDGQLIATVPGSRKVFQDDPRGLNTGGVVVPGRLFVFDIRDMRDRIARGLPLERIEQKLDVGGEPYGISTTSTSDRLVFTNRRLDNSDPATGTSTGGIGLLDRSPGSRTWNPAKYLDLTLGSSVDAFDVNNAQGIVILDDLSYAFVTGMNQYIQGVPSRDPDISRFNPAGGNVGIIRDPFGLFPGDPKYKGLIAATRMIPYSSPDNLVLSPDQESLYAAYPGVGQVHVFSVNAIIDEVEAAILRKEAGGTFYLDRWPIDNLVRVPLSDDEDGIVDGVDTSRPNAAIDLRADYRLPFNALQRVFANFDPARAPLSTSVLVRGLAAQDQFLDLIGPTRLEVVDDTTPTFTWTTGTREAKSRIYVSTFPPGSGLFPNDPIPQQAPGATGGPLAFGDDVNRNRIFSQDLGFDIGTVTFDLPDSVTLTRGQEYWWGIEAVTADGRVFRKSQQFELKPLVIDTPTPADRFSSVTLITHGFQLPYISEGQAEMDVADIVALGAMIAKQGGGELFIYEPTTGGWFSPKGNSVTPDDALGKPLVLISDWATESVISDSGFAEGAADAIFAGLARLMGEQLYGEAMLKSPWHLIGFSRGASVTSEIVQRLGTYFPTGTAGGIADLHVTMLDPHDFAQDSLKVPLGQVLSWASTAASVVPAIGPALSKLLAGIQKYATFTGNKTVAYDDFKDPDMLNWANIGFLENYYQLASGVAGSTSTFNHIRLFDGFTPNGRPIVGADVNLDLTGRPGFHRDDLLVGIGTTHMRVKTWYAGTVDLDLTDFPEAGNPSMAPDRIWRRVADRVWEPTGLLSSAKVSFDDKAFPWYRNQEVLSGAYVQPTEPNAELDLTHAWEGIGTGWFFSELGGGVALRPHSTVARTDVETDNTEFGGFDAPVPTLFNGNFQASIRPFIGRFPVPFFANETWLEVPGWSMHGGDGAELQGLRLAVGFKADALITLEAKLADAISDFERSNPGLGNVVQALRNDLFGSVIEALGKLNDFQKDGSVPSGVGGLTDIAGIANTIFTQVRDFLESAMSSVGPGPVKSIFDKITAGFRARVQEALKPDLLGAFIDFVRYGQEELFDYSMTLFEPLDSVTHNRFYLSPDATELNLEIARGGTATGAALQVYATLQSTLQYNQRVDIGSISLADLPDGNPVTGGDFVKRTLALPPGLAGQAMTLTFELVGGGLAGPTVWIDDVTFANPVEVHEQSGVPDDGFVLFLDNVDLTPDRLTLSSPIQTGNTPIAHVTGNNQHEIKITNTSAEAVEYRIVVDPNWFLVLTNDGGTGGPLAPPLALNGNEREALPNTYLVAAGDTLTLTFAATLNTDGLEELTTEDAWVMRGDIIVQELGQVNGNDYVRGQTRVQTYYFTDVSDWDRDDGILQFADTLQGHERVMKIRNDSPFLFSIDPSGANTRFDMIGQSGQDIRVKFEATGVDATPVRAPLVLSRGGSEMGRLEVEGRSEAAQTLPIPVTGITNQLLQLYDAVGSS